MNASDQLWAIWAYPSAAVHGEIVRKSVYVSIVVVILVHKINFWLTSLLQQPHNYIQQHTEVRSFRGDLG